MRPHPLFTELRGCHIVVHPRDFGQLLVNRGVQIRKLFSKGAIVCENRDLCTCSPINASRCLVVSSDFVQGLVAYCAVVRSLIPSKGAVVCENRDLCMCSPHRSLVVSLSHQTLCKHLSPAVCLLRFCRLGPSAHPSLAERRPVPIELGPPIAC